jgi:hypothetical protein
LITACRGLLSGPAPLRPRPAFAAPAIHRTVTRPQRHPFRLSA